MTLKRGFALSVFALSLAAAFPALALAVAAVNIPAHPIHVSRCHPQRNEYVAAGYTPGYYPYGAGPYWGWPSVYGPMYYQYPTSGHPTLAIDYVNVTSDVMKQIEFGLVVHGTMIAEVKDVGTFSPGAEIKHEFGVSSNIFPIQTSYAQCVPLKITFENGTTWHNPHLPALRASIYGKPHY